MPIRNSSLSFRLGAVAFLLTLAGGFIAPFTPVVWATPAPIPSPMPAPDSSSPAPAASVLGTVDLSPTPPNDTQAVPPNVVVTFDDSGSMAFDYMGDNPPFNYIIGTDRDGNPIAESWDNGRWYCAGVIDPTATSGLGASVMNGVYYNPNIYYAPPVKADGTLFPAADATLKAVDDDGVTAHRPLDPQKGDQTNFINPEDKYGNSANWTCPYDSRSPIPGGGPYYYKYKGPSLSGGSDGKPTATDLGNLYKNGNWTAVSVTNAALVIDGKAIKDADGNAVTQYQNWANWWAYYHTRNLMARTSLSRVFGSSALSASTPSGGFGNDIRVAWQNLYDNYCAYTVDSDGDCGYSYRDNRGRTQWQSMDTITDDYILQASTIISSLIDTDKSSCASPEPTLGSQILQAGTVKTAPSCYRSDFFNWIFQVPAISGTPTRGATDRAGKFFERGGAEDPNNISSGDLHDPYWQPAKTGQGDGSELSCRQNFHMLVTDGLWNGAQDGPKRTDLTLPSTVGKLPDGVSFPSTSSGIGSIYADVDDAGNDGYASLSDIAFDYWAKNLRPDLYKPSEGKFVSPYLPDTKTGVIAATSDTTGSKVSSTNINPEVYFNPKNDPATWPHMSEYMIGLGVSGTLNYSDNTDCTSDVAADKDACNLRKGSKNSSGSIGWPTPDGSGNGIAANIDDTWHAALAGRGQFFSASNPQTLVDQLTKVLSSISARTGKPVTSAVNASVLTEGTLSFETGYSSVDWTGILQAVTLNADGTQASTGPWNAVTKLDDIDYTTRSVFTVSMGTDGKTTGMDFKPDAVFDDFEKTGLTTPALPDSGDDTLANRVKYLRGDQELEAGGTMRSRKHLLGAIINSQPVYVSYPDGGYTDNYPTGSPEAAEGAQTYDEFITANSGRPGTLYVGANDGMLHAFNAALKCHKTDDDGNCIDAGPEQDDHAGEELWAFVPRAVYPNLGNLTSATDFKFAPTVDGTPVVRDVFFSSDSNWHTLLVGGLRLGGRGVYALDVTNPQKMTKDDVLWEFDADSTASGNCVVIAGDAKSSDKCNPADLGYTYGQPNIGRLADGKWVVIVPTGYYPDCSKADAPTPCETLPAASNKYSALFVLDAQTGAQIAEIKTPVPASAGDVTSYGLSSPVLGDYQNDHIDDVAYAGDLNGNLWRFDLSDSSPDNWKVTLAYQPATQGAQPITVMPRLFPDPTTNRFMVVFGTGKYLGADDNTSASAVTQSIYGIRDKLKDEAPVTIKHDDLQSQTLSEVAGTGDLAGTTLRKLTTNSVSASMGGWYIDLDTKNDGNASGERVVVTPGALFDTNTAIIQTLIPGGNDPCNPTVLGAVMFIDANSGGPGSGVSSIGGSPYVGARVNNVRTSGSIPVTTPVGGGRALLPGLTLTGGKNPDTPFAGDAPVWRRRSWSVINNVH